MKNDKEYKDQATQVDIKPEVSPQQKRMELMFRTVGAVGAGIAGLAFGPAAIVMVPALAMTGFILSKTLATTLSQKLNNTETPSSGKDRMAVVIGAGIGLVAALTVPTIGIPVALAAMCGGGLVAKKLLDLTSTFFNRKGKSSYTKFSNDKSSIEPQQDVKRTYEKNKDILKDISGLELPDQKTVSPNSALPRTTSKTPPSKQL